MSRPVSCRIRRPHCSSSPAKKALRMDAIRELLRLPVQAEEMCELCVNGRDAGAAFWSPCSFELKGLLHPGVNRLRLTVTGSLANRYGLRPVSYGLDVAETL